MLSRVFDIMLKIVKLVMIDFIFDNVFNVVFL